MGHKIAEAIIEDGKLKYVNKKLPAGKLKVHLIYDMIEKTLTETEIANIINEASGLYKDIDVEAESRKLRGNWERDVHG